MRWFEDFKKLASDYLRSLQFDQNKTAGKADRDSRKRTSILLYFGLQGQLYSREEISVILEVTNERVRQVILEGIADIKELIFKDDNEDLFATSYDSIQELKEDLESKNVLSYNGFLKSLCVDLNLDSDVVKPYFNLLVEVLGFKKIKTHLHHLRDNDLIITASNLNSKRFIKICYASYLIIEKHVVPIDLNDLIIGVKNKFKKEQITNEEIFTACSAIDAISVDSESNKYQIDFERLSSLHDMAYRVLFEKGQSMKLAEVLKEINHRLHGTDSKPAGKISLNTQMNMDERLVPLGKSGYWTLNEWNEVNKTMYELISDTLVLFNKPLEKKEIYDHIHKSRPNVPTRSLDTVIYNKRYKKIQGNKFILTEWSDIYKNEIVKPQARIKVVKVNPVHQQIKDQIVSLFNENSSTSILLSTIVKSLNKSFDFPKASIYKAVSENAEFETSTISKTKKLVTYKKAGKAINNPSKSTSVFVSYSWENEEHKEKVISFIDFLRNKGFEADMDIKFMQEETALDFNRLMHKGILKYDKVVIILSKSYKEKAESFEGGVGKEYKFITGDIEKKPKKYILASFNHLTKETLNDIVPADLNGREVVDLTRDESNDFQNLFSKLTESIVYKFSDVASNTPLVDSKTIKPFTLK